MNMYNPLTDKQALRDLAPEGFVYGGYDNGKFIYQKEIKGHTEWASEKHGILRETKYEVIEVLQEDLTKKNLSLMANYGLTRV